MMIILIVILLVVYVVCENSMILRIRREKLGSGVRIAHISDLHKRQFGRDNARLAAKIRGEKPDIIVISGDLVSRTETDFTSIERFLHELCGIADVYMALGNHEQSLPPDKQSEFLEMLEKTDVKLLRNEIRSVVVRGRRLEICGFEAEYSTYKKNGSYRDLDTVDAAEIERKLGKCPNGEILLIAHNPLFCEVYSEWGADFTFSGHVHGGVVRIPFTRIGLLSPERKFFPKYVYGLYKHGKMLLLVCGGIGKLRLFNPPEMVIYDI